EMVYLSATKGAWKAVSKCPTMRRSKLVQQKEKEKGTVSRTSQIVFGERQHLLRVLDSLEGTDVPIARRQQERRILEELIHARSGRPCPPGSRERDRKSTRLNSSHQIISYAVFCLKK